MARALRVEGRECCVVARNSAAWGRFFVKSQAVGLRIGAGCGDAPWTDRQPEMKKKKRQRIE